ncbi:MAG: chemotaxis response regulator protein-glutamate methylesterase [Nitrospirae bacterium]|nr:chemotaxis response regulator protein-glutamate methylesterase [Nitrospirota bacterium]
MKMIRVLVVDDSAFMRKMIPSILSSDPEIEVIGTAMDGLFALKKIRDLKPDVITLDVNMPRMDGIETLRHIVEDFGIPAIIVSSLTRKDAELTFKALEIGAFDFITKPQDAISVHIKDIGDELIEKVRAAFKYPAARLRIKKVHTSIEPKRAVIPHKEKGTFIDKRHADRLLVIGVSTGGPNALSYLLPQIPEDFAVPIAIVQHMPAGFTEMFAARLNSLCEIEVKEAEDGDLLIPGRALIAPGDRHLKIKSLPLGTIAVLSDSPPVNGHRPSVDVLFNSAAFEYDNMATGLIMTGMGSDGAEGIGEIMAMGGLTIAQDEESCIVYGMPKAAIEKGYIKKVMPLEDMADFLIEHFDRKRVSQYQDIESNDIRNFDTLTL